MNLKQTIKHVISNIVSNEICRKIPELCPSFYGLEDVDHNVSGIINGGNTNATTTAIVNQLEKLYCSSTGVEFMHIESLNEREWLIKEYEAIQAQEVDDVTKKEIAEAMLISQNFDNFVGAKFPTVKRYGGEGAESCIPFYREIFKLASANDAGHVFMCMAHRGKILSKALTLSQFLPCNFMQED